MKTKKRKNKMKNETIKGIKLLKKGIKDKLASLRQADAVPKWEVARDVSDDYRKQMLSEMKKDVTNSKTKQVEQRWVRIGGRPNHLWDCECIALASAMLAGVLPIGAES